MVVALEKSSRSGDFGCRRTLKNRMKTRMKTYETPGKDAELCFGIASAVTFSWVNRV